MSALATILPDRIWSFERPVWFGGVRLRTRTTVLRLEDGSLLMHSPAPASDALREELRSLGTVRWLVIPNCFHHLGTPAAAAQFPDAQVVAPASALPRNAALKCQLDLRDPALAAELPELELLPLDGVPYLDETLMFHRPTQTLLAADAAICACAADHWTVRWAARLTGFYESVRVPPDVRPKLPNKAATARSLRAIVARPALRLIVGHAEVIDRSPVEQLAQAWRREGVEV